MILFLLLLVVVAIGLGLYATENTATQSITFWHWHWAGVAVWWPVVAAAVIVGGLFLLYMIYSALAHGVRVGSMRRRVSTREQAINDMRGENQRLREENARLRAQPRTGERVPTTTTANPNLESADRPADRTTTTPAYRPQPTFGERVRAFFSGRQPAGY